MHDEAGFLRAMLDDPDDRAVRQIFADWLDEHDDPRGEFLRLQDELAAWVPDLARRSELQRRQSDWLARHEVRLLSWPPLAHCRTVRHEAGLARISISAEALLSRPVAESGADWLRQGWVRTVRLSEVAGRIEDLAESPALAGVAGLELVNEDLTDADVRRLLAAPALSELRELNLCGNNLTGTGLLRALLGLPSFAGLRCLDVRNNAISGIGVRRILAEAAVLPLRRLDLHGNVLGPQGWVAYRLWAERREQSASGPPRRLINSLGMCFNLIPAGTFLLGAPAEESEHRSDEVPQHAVTISRPFYLSVFPVTQYEYETVMGVNPSRFAAGRSGGGNHPVEQVVWNDAITFCRRLSELPAEKAAGHVYRLPTEAEWEHACRAGTTTPFWMGGPPCSTEVNYDGNYHYGGAPAGPYVGRPTPVGLYPSNPFGLYDMHGNVWEWVNDWHDRAYYARSPAVDPPGPASGTTRVQRGGSWDCIGAYCRAAHRHGDPPDRRDHFTGFRVVCSL
jgi:uncharacterized protein (TIGR02996 family)